MKKYMFVLFCFIVGSVLAQSGSNKVISRSYTNDARQNHYTNINYAIPKGFVLIERTYTYLGTNYMIRYEEYPTNYFPNVPAEPVLHIRSAAISVYKINGVTNKVCPSFMGISVQSTNFYLMEDEYYVKKALSYPW